MLAFQLLIPLSWVSLISAQKIVENLSFGSKGTISSNSFSIPNWRISGEGHSPQLLSDKVILTPPYGGNRRGALWTENINSEREWEVNVDFRIGGPDYGKANMAIWYVKDANAVSTSSIYAVGKFEGLALMLDQNNGVQKIRGYLNDGTTQFRNNVNIDGLAFGHCDYNYRNRGTPSKLRIRYTSNGLEVSIDGQDCFSSSKVSLPSEYHFGVTAASADPPDSVEIFRFETLSTSAHTIENLRQNNGVLQNILKSNSASANMNAGGSGGGSASSNDAAYQNFNQRLNLIEKSITNMFSEINKHTKAEEARYNEILQLLKGGSQAGGLQSNLEKRLNYLDNAIGTLNRDIHRVFDHDEKFTKLNQQLEHTMDGIGHMPKVIHGYVERHTPRIGFIAFSFMAFQTCCLVLLLWQKYRKSTMPKKFL